MIIQRGVVGNCMCGCMCTHKSELTNTYPYLILWSGQSSCEKENCFLRKNALRAFGPELPKVLKYTNLLTYLVNKKLWVSQFRKSSFCFLHHRSGVALLRKGDVYGT